MVHTFRYRSALARCVLTIVGVAAASLTAAHAAGCGGIVVVDGEQRNGAGGAGGDSTTGSSPSGGSCEPTSTSVTGGPGGETLQQTTKCFEWTSGSLCPVKEIGAGLVVATPCGSIRSVDCGPIQDGTTCCYVVTETVEGCLD
jgi:hypothetical protein